MCLRKKKKKSLTASNGHSYNDKYDIHNGDMADRITMIPGFQHSQWKITFFRSLDVIPVLGWGRRISKKHYDGENNNFKHIKNLEFPFDNQ